MHFDKIMLKMTQNYLKGTYQLKYDLMFTTSVVDLDQDPYSEYGSGYTHVNIG